MKELKGIKELESLKVGDKIFWGDKKQEMTIKARNERYLIVTGNGEYSIIDLKEKVCSTNDYVFNPYDYSKQSDIEKSLYDLEKGEYELSRRNKVKIIDVIKGYKMN